MSELCLGTVQFGMKYGVNNAIGRQPSWEESFEMLDYALHNGVKVIDTARAYGEAELVLGEYLKSKGVPEDLRIISKLRPNIICPDEKDIFGFLEREAEDSLKRIGISRLDGYLLHTPEYIYNHGILSGMVKLKERGYTENIGISIYGLPEGYAAIDTNVIDYIQLPYSILDQRGIKEGFIPAAKEAGIKIFTRSAFLQGLFMMDSESVPAHLKNTLPYLELIEEILGKYGVDKVSAVLAFVQYEKDIDYLVFGVEKKEQLEENIFKNRHGNVPEECIQELKDRINGANQSVIFPSLWSNGRKAL